MLMKLQKKVYTGSYLRKAWLVVSVRTSAITHTQKLVCAAMMSVESITVVLATGRNTAYPSPVVLLRLSLRWPDELFVYLTP